MKVKLAILLGLVIVMVFVWAQVGQIWGYVYYEPGDNPVEAGIPVVIYNNTYNDTCFTNESGRYWSGTLGFDTYYVYAYKTTGNPTYWSDTFRVIVDAQHQSVQQNIILYEQ